MLKEQDLTNLNLTLVAEKLHYTFNELNISEFNGVTKLLHKNPR